MTRNEIITTAETLKLDFKRNWRTDKILELVETELKVKNQKLLETIGGVVAPLPTVEKTNIVNVTRGMKTNPKGKGNFIGFHPISGLPVFR